jgi:hypothetical protein
MASRLDKARSVVLTRLLSLAAALLWCGGALAQSSPGLTTGQIPSATQWNSFFAAKADWPGVFAAVNTWSAAQNFTNGLQVNGVDFNTAWTTFTPSPSCGTATFTVTSAKSKIIGKVTFIEIDITITATGTCTSILSFTLPNTPNSSGSIVGQEVAGINNKAFACRIISGSVTATCIYADGGGTSFAINQRLVASTVFENQ